MDNFLLGVLIAIIMLIIATCLEALYHYYQPQLKYRKDEKLLTLHWNHYNKGGKWIGRKKVNIKFKRT